MQTLGVQGTLSGRIYRIIFQNTRISCNPGCGRVDWRPMPDGLPRRSPGAEKSPSSLVIHNVVVSGRRTSVRLEPVMWEALQDIARRQERTVHDLVTQIDRERTASSLTAAIRVYIVAFYRSAAALGAPRPAQPTPFRM